MPVSDKHDVHIVQRPAVQYREYREIGREPLIPMKILTVHTDGLALTLIYRRTLSWAYSFCPEQNDTQYSNQWF